LRIKISRPDKNPQNPQKFSPSKILGIDSIFSREYTIYVLGYMIIQEAIEMDQQISYSYITV